MMSHPDDPQTGQPPRPWTAVREHSRHIRVMRIALPVVALGVAFGYIVLAQPAEIDPDFERQFAQLDDQDDMRMAAPRFSGEDAKGNFFEVSADTAQHNPGEPETIALENPRAIRAEGLDNELSASASIGVLRPDESQVDLSENVKFTRGFGGQIYSLETDSAIVGLEDRTLEATSNVYGTSERGTIKADGMMIDDETGVVTFTNARMILKPKQSGIVVESQVDRKPDAPAGTKEP
ncbi:MAG: LPS export ABC transporter periplasmic protein LptC [Parvularculaceae bacterium]